MVAIRRQHQRYTCCCIQATDGRKDFRCKNDVMALCTALNPPSSEAVTQYYPYPSFCKLHHICESSLPVILDFERINHIQFIDGLNRSFSVENTSRRSSTSSQSARRSSLQVQQSEMKFQSKAPISNDLSFGAVVEEDSEKRHYSTKTPYRPPSRKHRLSSPPPGFKPVCVQLLARHGSRTLTSHAFDLQTLRIWQLAKEKNMLTPLGEQLKTDTERFMEANNLLGRGELTQLGKDEHIGIGARLFSRMAPLFTSSNTVSVMTSGKKRVVDSAQHFISGLTQSQPNLRISTQNPNKNLLYFHKSCPAYMAFKKADPSVRTKLNAIKNLEQTKRYARQVLHKLYQKEFVELLINGSYRYPTDENSDPMDEAAMQNEVEIVLCLYCMFSVAPAQSEPGLSKMLAKYFNLEESTWFAYISDAQEFYLKGPSIEGTTVTYDMAKPLLIDFFSSTAACMEQPNTTPTAHLRFAHAETVIPFASLLQIPGFSDQAVDPTDIYTYENNRWRGAHIASMAANVQWEIYRHEYDHNRVLVRMLYNEMEVRFKSDCRSIAPNSYFYDFNELKRSYAKLLLSSDAEMN